MVAAFRIILVAVVLMEAKDAEKRGLNPLGRFVAWASAGCEPDEMGIGPIYAVPKLLKRHGPITFSQTILTSREPELSKHAALLSRRRGFTGGL